ncbi:MAG: hypothetical protein KY476_08890 [Planctomycetes bacterium]|nr:hypothetical protein [Planctomycetota bacterium]
MLAENFDQSLRGFHRRRPFRPFLVELVSGSTVRIEHPEALVYRAGSAVYIAANGEIHLFDHEGVSRISDVVESTQSA